MSTSQPELDQHHIQGNIENFRVIVIVYGVVGRVIDSYLCGNVLCIISAWFAGFLFHDNGEDDGCWTHWSSIGDK